MAASIDGGDDKRNSVRKPSSSASTSVGDVGQGAGAEGRGREGFVHADADTAVTIHDHDHHHESDPASLIDRSSNSSLRHDDDDGEIFVLSAAGESPLKLTTNQVLKDGEEVILKQFNIRQIKREYSRTQGTPDRPKSTSGLSGLTLSGVDWGGMVSGAVHNTNKSNNNNGTKTCTSDNKGKATTTCSRARLDSTENLLLGRPKSSDERDPMKKNSKGRDSSSFGIKDIAEGSIRTRRTLHADMLQRSQSADSALSPSGRKTTDRTYKSRRMSARNLLNPDLMQTDKLATASRSRRVLQTELGNIDEKVSSASAGGSRPGRSGSGGDGGSKTEKRTRRKSSTGEHKRAETGNGIARRPRSERILSSTRPQRQHSDGGRRTTRSGDRSSRTSTSVKTKSATAGGGVNTSSNENPGRDSIKEKERKEKLTVNCRSVSPGTRPDRTKTRSPHEPSSSTRGMHTAAASTSLERRPNTTINHKPRSTRRGSFDMAQSGIGKQSSIRW